MGILPWHGPLVQLRPLRPWPFAVEPADEHLYCKQKKESFIPGSLDTTITTAAPCTHRWRRRRRLRGRRGSGYSVSGALSLSSHTTSRCWGAGGAIGRSVNPISTRVGRLCPPNNTGTPGFSDLPPALLHWASVVHNLGRGQSPSYTVAL